ncbi:MAG: DUF1289 domain-containing protein [Chlorobi bacterium]|nr:DUF1289 domain-containing protein [Chlorobiota bacterium]
MDIKFDYDNYISPCIDKCRLDVDKTYCIACKRTVEEKKNWKTYTKEEKLKIMEELKSRKW